LVGPGRGIVAGMIAPETQPGGLRLPRNVLGGMRSMVYVFRLIRTPQPPASIYLGENRTMKKLVLSLAAAPAFAARGDMWLGGTTGFALPFGDFADIASIGYNLGVTGDYVLNDQWAIGGEVGYYTFGGNDDLEKRLTAQYATPVDFRFRALPVTIHGKYLLPGDDKKAPFIKGAIGMYNVNSSVEGGLINTDDSQTAFGFQLGGGVNFKTGTNFTWGGDVLYHYIGTENSSNMLTARATLMFGFSRNGTPTTQPPTPTPTPAPQTPPSGTP
jgi:hypothetical protein